MRVVGVDESSGVVTRSGFSVTSSVGTPAAVNVGPLSVDRGEDSPLADMRLAWGMGPPPACRMLGTLPYECRTENDPVCVVDGRVCVKGSGSVLEEDTCGDQAYFVRNRRVCVTERMQVPQARPMQRLQHRAGERACAP